MPTSTPPTAVPADQSDELTGSTASAGASTGQDKPRIFPCESCGADLEFNIGVQNLRCPYCGFVKELATDEAAAVAEQDYESALERLAQHRSEGATDLPDAREVHCSSCGAVVRFTGTLTSQACAYCGSPLQTDDVHQAEDRIPVDGVLPFGVSRAQARSNSTLR